MAQPGTAQIKIFERKPGIIFLGKVLWSLFPQGYPGSNPGRGAFFI